MNTKDIQLLEDILFDLNRGISIDVFRREQLTVLIQKEKGIDFCECVFPELTQTGMYCGGCEKPFPKHIQEAGYYKDPRANKK